MAAWCRCILIAMLVVGPAWRLSASPAETRAFDAAANEFRDGFFEFAAADFGDFVQRFPASPRVPEAVLLEAQARIQLEDYAGALSLLSGRQAQAGALADEYVFWQGVAAFESGQFQAAAEAFGKVLRDFPGSTRRLEAAVREAASRAALAEWPRVLETLQQTNGVFQLAVQANQVSEVLPWGYLLLGEAHLAQRAYPAAEAALQPLAKHKLDSDSEWQRQYLLCRIMAADGRSNEALQLCRNLEALAAATRRPALQAQARSFAFEAGVLERLGRPDEARAVYEKNLAEKFPAEQQRQALLKIAELALASGKPTEAVQVLDKFLAQFPTSELADLALLTIGELRLWQHGSGPPAVATVTTTNAPATTNLLQLAEADFQAFTNRFPASPFRGRAELNLGWCYWLDGKIPESQSAFRSAAAHLPLSMDQAVALLKLGDAQTRLADLAGAISTYSDVVAKYAGRPEAQTNLLETALYLLLRTGIAAGNLSVATNALDKLVASYPQSANTESAVLLTAQEMALRDPAAARQVISSYLQTRPGAALRPEMELALGRALEQQGLWEEAIRQYDQWLSAFTNHDAQAKALYCRACATLQARHETEALSQFTNFVARFPTHPDAPLAQLQVAHYYYNHDNFPEAEKNYQLIFQNTNWLASELTFEARMMAGRAAVRQQGWKGAREYFAQVAGNTNCPPELRAQAYIALGDALISQVSTNKVEDYSQALSAFDQVAALCPSNAIAVLAIGKRASCFLQSQDYAQATNGFQRVLDSPLADAAARSIAKVGLGLTLEKIAEQQPQLADQRALLNRALGHYLDVLYQKDKLLREGEEPDLFWTLESGLKAARLCEKLNLLTQAINVLQHLRQLHPGLRLDERLAALKALQGQNTLH